jgi:uncharacterized protein (DUF1697 family)
MNSKKIAEKYVAFLRGINVGGHHKVPMADLRKELEKFDLENVVTLLNSGNVIFNSIADNPKSIENMISRNLEKAFGFPIPTIIRNSRTIYQLVDDSPFKDVRITKDIRLYVSFLRKSTQTDLELPWASSDNSFKIIEKRDNAILSVLDLSVSKTPHAMKVVEKYFGTDITTRNWKTIERIANKL